MHYQRHNRFLTVFATLTLSFAIANNASAEPTELPNTIVQGSPDTGLFLDSKSVPVDTGGDSASIFGPQPGVSLQTGGGVSSLPVIHGLADDRVGIQVDGAAVVSACPNHMNPPLSYVDPTQVGTARLFSGLSPVSLGGDNLGSTVVIESRQPVFAGAGESVHDDAQITSYRRSNESYGGSLYASAAGRWLGLAYSGAWNRAGDYEDGRGNRVTSTYYKNSVNAVTVALKTDDQLLTVQGALHETPHEGFVNEQMDLTSNHGKDLNFRYEGKFDWGVLDGRAYWQTVQHEMNVGRDKSLFPMPMFMPMDTHGKNRGYTLAATTPVTDRQSVKTGIELLQFRLDDRWPPVDGTAPYMAPDEFVNLNSGRRDRLAAFGELESRWSDNLVSSIGIRVESVRSDAGQVHGYSDMYADDATAFNQRSHERSDTNVDLSFLLKAKPSATFSLEGGFVRKNRAPSLYERYAWSSNMMISGMINWFGDGNYYVGNLDLRPETANTVSATASWHDAASKKWELRVTPYYTYVQNYIDVDLLGAMTYGESTFSQLQFANHNATLTGLDLAASVAVWEDPSWGTGRVNGTVNWVQAKRQDQGGSLYHTPPLNARLALEESLATGWKITLEGQAVAKKNKVDLLRNEPITPGYALLNFRTSYQWKNTVIELGVENLFNRDYALPLGGVNFDDYLVSGWSGKIAALHGPGRTFFASISWRL